MPRTVTARSIDQHLKTEIRVGEHAVLADEPADRGGSDAGPTPGELLLGALGA